MRQKAGEEPGNEANTATGWLSRGKVDRWGLLISVQRECANSITSLRDITYLPLPRDNLPAKLQLPGNGGLIRTVSRVLKSLCGSGYLLN